MKILCPSYFYATDKAWNTLIESNNGSVLTIINPYNGVGDAHIEDYRRLCVRLRKAGIGVMGYVSTKYGKRIIWEVQEEIDRYSAWYGVNDIFVDEAASDLGTIDYYNKLYGRIRGLAVLNHGTIPDEAYLQCGDILVIFESTYAKHAIAKFPHWIKRHPKKRFCQLVHTCPDAKSMKRAITKAAETSEFVYVTNDVLDNPWDMLPTYWKQELKACK